MKIDRSFVSKINVEVNKAIVDAIIFLGHRMKLGVTAEGVETKEQLDYLVESGCDKVQGYYFSKPLPPDEAIRMVQKESNYFIFSLYFVSSKPKRLGNTGRNPPNDIKQSRVWRQCLFSQKKIHSKTYFRLTEALL